MESQTDEERKPDKVARSALLSEVYGVTIFEKLFLSNVPETAVLSVTDKVQ